MSEPLNWLPPTRGEGEGRGSRVARIAELEAENARLKADAWGPAIVRSSVLLRARAEAAEARMERVLATMRRFVRKDGATLLTVEGVNFGTALREALDPALPASPSVSGSHSKDRGSGHE